MPESDWRVVVAWLQALSSRPTVEQLDLAAKLGAPVAADTPRPVAAAILRSLLRESLALEADASVSDAQLEYLKDLAAETSSSFPDNIGSRELLDAWIMVMYARRAIEHLQNLQPAPGDIVAVFGDESRLGEISSISLDGRLNFRGGLGFGARPHQVRVVARSDDAGAEDLRYRARQQAAARTPVRSEVGATRLSELAPWQVTGVPGYASIGALRDALAESAAQQTHEVPLQRALERYPEILAYLVDGHHGTHVVPQAALGRDYVPDFLVAGQTSGGIRWTLVELESPNVALSIKDGQAAKELRKAIKQITDWREWLGNNLDYARRSRNDNGLGLPGIRADAQGLVIIGRGRPTDEIDAMRHRARYELDIEIRTYDWLVRAAGTERERSLGVLDSELRGLFDDEEPVP